MEGGCGESRSISPVGRTVGPTLKRRRGGTVRWPMEGGCGESRSIPPVGRTVGPTLKKGACYAESEVEPNQTVSQSNYAVARCACGAGERRQNGDHEQSRLSQSTRRSGDPQGRHRLLPCRVCRRPRQQESEGRARQTTHRLDPPVAPDRTLRRSQLQRRYADIPVQRIRAGFSQDPAAAIAPGQHSRCRPGYYGSTAGLHQTSAQSASLRTQVLAGGRRWDARRFDHNHASQCKGGRSDQWPDAGRDLYVPGPGLQQVGLHRLERLSKPYVHLTWRDAERWFLPAPWGKEKTMDININDAILRILTSVGRIEGELTEIRKLSDRVSKLEQWVSWLKGGWAALAAAY